LLSYGSLFPAGSWLVHFSTSQLDRRLDKGISANTARPRLDISGLDHLEALSFSRCWTHSAAASAGAPPRPGPSGRRPWGPGSTLHPPSGSGSVEGDQLAARLVLPSPLVVGN
jgi:hypothetical protein